MNSRFFIILLSLSFSGCSLLYSYSDNLTQQIDQWVTKNKYNTALNTIYYIKPSHKDYIVLQEKKGIIEQQMLSYERGAIESSTYLTNQGDWIKAFKLLEIVSSNIMDDTKIKTHHLKLLNLREKVIVAYEMDILYTKAANISKSMKLYNKIKKTVAINETNQLNISEFNESRIYTTLMLANLSQQQYDKNQFNYALKSIQFALKLSPEKDVAERLKETKLQIKNATKLQKASHIKEAKILLSKLSQGYSHAILSNTTQTIVWLHKNKDDKNPYSKLINKLEIHLAKGVKQRFEAARNLYSKGKTQEALSIWLKLKELEPNNAKLLSHIERAEKVLSKLKELSNKPKNKK